MNELLVKSKVTTGVENEPYAEPSADPSPEAWQAFHHQFRDCFARRETWEQLFRYWMERCGKEALAEGTATGPGGTGSERSRQRFLSAASWDEEKLMARYHGQVRAALGDRDVALVFLEAGFAKKGEESAGTVRQSYDPSGRIRAGIVMSSPACSPISCTGMDCKNRTAAARRRYDDLLRQIARRSYLCTRNNYTNDCHHSRFMARKGGVRECK